MTGADDAFATNLYYDRDFATNAAKILPGQYYATGKDMLIVTVLGSCVSACIRDNMSGIGGMNHFMLPDGGSKETSPLGMSARYGTFAMELLINQVLKLGARRTNLEAKVFGGGNVLAGMTVANVGERNADFVLKFLKSEGIRIIAQDLVDIYPRKVYYFPKTGKVMVRKLRTIHNHTILERETDYRSRLKATDQGGDVELFG
jgi:chemotaxis protein CheD